MYFHNVKQHIVFKHIFMKIIEHESTKMLKHMHKDANVVKDESISHVFKWNINSYVSYSFLPLFAVVSNGKKGLSK